MIPTQAQCLSGDFSSEGIKVFLGCDLGVFRAVVPFFRPDIHDKTDREEVEIRNRNPDLHPRYIISHQAVAVTPGEYVALTQQDIAIPY